MSGDAWVQCLDQGYVRLVDSMGDELSIVNAARVSYDKESEYTRTGQLQKKDQGLLNFLSTHQHESPFRHCFFEFEVYAPLMVARQWWKYVVGSDHIMDAWNESSRRYVTEEPKFYVPYEWRSAAENSKQGSSDPVDSDLGNLFTKELERIIDDSENLYNLALKKGICAEQARLFLPAYGMYVRWRWAASLQSVLHFLSQRLGHDAQKEISEYASAVEHIVQPMYPTVFRVWPTLMQGDHNETV